MQLTESVVVKPFESFVLQARLKITITVMRMQCSTFIMESWNGTLPLGLVVTRTYTMLKRGSKTIPVVLCNITSTPIHFNKGHKITHVQVCNKVPHPWLKAGTLEYLEELEGAKPTLSVQEHQDKLIDSLDLSGLKTWTADQARHAHKLLREYHDVFSLEDKLGCTSQVKHHIVVTDDEPFKERIRGTPPPLLEEVRTHVNDTLKDGAIKPSNSA